MMNNVQKGIIAAAIIAAVICAIAAAISRARSDAATARAEAAEAEAAQLEKSLEDCQRASAVISQARETEVQGIRDKETAEHEAVAQFNEIRRDTCHSDDVVWLDDKLRELAVEAYRVAVCTGSTADNPPMPAAAGADAP